MKCRGWVSIAKHTERSPDHSDWLTNGRIDCIDEVSARCSRANYPIFLLKCTLRSGHVFHRFRCSRSHWMLENQKCFRKYAKMSFERISWVCQRSKKAENCNFVFINGTTIKLRLAVRFRWTVSNQCKLAPVCGMKNARRAGSSQNYCYCFVYFCLSR